MNFFLLSMKFTAPYILQRSQFLVKVRKSTVVHISGRGSSSFFDHTFFVFNITENVETHHFVVMFEVKEFYIYIFAQRECENN